MLRDNLVGLIEPMLSSAGANPLALCIAQNESSDDRPPCLENPRPEGAESTIPAKLCKGTILRGRLNHIGGAALTTGCLT